MEHPSFGPYTVFIRGEGLRLEDLWQGNRNVTTDMEKAEVLVESYENTQAPGVPAKVASSCKAGEALQSLAWTVELLSLCMDTNGSEPSANGDHAEQCLIHKVCTPRTVFFHLGFTRFNS